MNRGLYNSASAVLTLNKNMNVKTQNIANMNTVGYKHDNFTNKTFNEVFLSYKSQNLGELPSKIGVGSVDTVYTQGSFMNTERLLDFAISGDGFFKVDLGNGNVAYTRNGSFKIDLNGYLTDDNGHYILGNNGRIQLQSLNNVSVSKDGTIYQNNKMVDKISVVDLENPTKRGNSYFVSSKESPSNSEINQGYLEASNTDVAKELTDVIVIQRHLTSNFKMIQSQDELNKRMIDGLSK